MPGVKRLTQKRHATKDAPVSRGYSPFRHPELVEGSDSFRRSERPGNYLAGPFETSPPAQFSRARLILRQTQDDRPFCGIVFAAADPQTETAPDIDVEEKLKDAFARGWSVIVWNDPINLMDYVVYVFKAVLKMNEKEAARHMWEVHQLGKSVVARETREKSELLVHRLRGFGLNATLEKA